MKAMPARSAMLLVGICLLFGSLSHGQKPSSQAQLAKRQDNLLRNQERLKQAREERDLLEENLTALQAERQNTEDEKKQLVRSLQSLTQNLRQQEIQRRKLAVEVKVQQARVNAMLKQGWRMSALAPWRFVLAPEAPDRVARQLGWLRYLVRQRRQEIRVLEGLRAEKIVLIKGIRLDREKQAAKRVQLNDRNEQLTALEKNSRATRAMLDRAAATLRTEQVSIRKSIASLKALLKRFRNKKRIHFGGTGLGNEALPWPVSGDIVVDFGDSRKDARLLWQGILISGKPNEQVRAVHPGRVLFAGEFKGWGVVSIVDHGNNFLSLYGYNERVIKAAGDFVEAGEALAVLPTMEGAGVVLLTSSEPVLYFSILQNNVPVNPRKWLTPGR